MGQVSRESIVSVVYRNLPGAVCGYFDPVTGAIHIDRRMPKRSQRCTLVHESIHRVLGHGPAKSPAEHMAREVAVERIAARQLITFPDLVTAMTQHKDAAGMAGYLDVDEPLLYARVFSLDPLEQTIFEACARHCIGVGAEGAFLVATIPRGAFR